MLDRLPFNPVFGHQAFEQGASMHLRQWWLTGRKQDDVDGHRRWQRRRAPSDEQQHSRGNQ
jgi:hypothetical protein